MPTAPECARAPIDLADSVLAEALTTGHGANASDARIPVMPQNDPYVSGIDTAAITSRARRRILAHFR